MLLVYGCVTEGTQSVCGYSQTNHQHQNTSQKKTKNIKHFFCSSVLLFKLVMSAWERTYATYVDNSTNLVTKTLQ